MNPQLNKLTRMRQEWEEAADGESLLSTKGSVGHILADVTKALELSEDERLEVLGANLYVDLNGSR
jgi:hypothetical protein